MSSPNDKSDAPQEQDPPAVVEDAPDSELDEEEEVITMQDVLEEEFDLEQDADAVLGASDDAKCTYPSGYVGRQALYACKTCSDETGITDAGVCLACSYKCHDGHELYELYTKRNFRCDCGEKSKFPGKECTFIVDKEASINNQYNQNFQGKYCTCHRPYPDPEDDEEDAMIQCIVCEDWFHTRHLVGRLPEGADFAELVCHICMDQLQFLWYYVESPQETGTKRTSDVHQEEPDAKRVCTENGIIPNGHSTESTEEEKPEVKKEDEIPVTETPVVENNTAIKAEEKDGCLLEKLKKDKSISELKGISYWGEGWRTKLCKCPACLKMYEELKCSFLTNEADTVHAYEEEGRRRIRSDSVSSSSSMERGMEAFSHIPRPQQVELLHGYNNLKEAFIEHFKSWADEGRVVTKKDVEEFMEKFKREQSRQIGSQALGFNCGR